MSCSPPSLAAAPQPLQLRRQLRRARRTHLHDAGHARPPPRRRARPALSRAHAIGTSARIRPRPTARTSHAEALRQDHGQGVERRDCRRPRTASFDARAQPGLGGHRSLDRLFAIVSAGQHAVVRHSGHTHADTIGKSSRIVRTDDGRMGETLGPPDGFGQ